VFGAVPAYLEKVNPAHTIFQNIEHLIIDKGSFFYNEVEYILREELREPQNYFVILRAIAQGKRKLSAIVNDTGFEKSKVSRYLDILINLGYVQKEIPVTEKYPEKSKLGLYKIHDKYFTFWFKYIFPNRNRIEIGSTDYVIQSIKNTYEHHLSVLYEDACLQLMRDLMMKGIIRFTSLGKWWLRNEEINIVALDEESNTTYFAECKWSNKKVGTDIYENLVRKSSLVDWHKGKRNNKFLLFSKSGFTPALLDRKSKEDILLIHKDRLCE